jgi:hypothetical protein
MRRNDDLIRALLLTIEAAPAGETVGGKVLRRDDAGDAEIVEHLKLLEDAGLLEVEFRRFLGDRGPQLDNTQVSRLTWFGHEFIASIRSDTVWNATKERVAKVGGSVSLSTLSEVAGAVAKGLLGI